ncbi:hypothetical protein HWV07_01375 [Natronomonas salina]|uniref:hypothetical protein n=1 Tax=Natronomonas salina TaxID=1710540 RepID=UPI0015B4DF26|nr:hypothetical protein [Natronomonas salina]QLD87756.1 hypothetical protein HWV07_01375 [Natronomonas salina]
MSRYAADATRTRAAALFVGSTVRYHWRDGDGLATVVEATDDRIAFHGPECDGRFTRDQIDRLFETDRLQIVLDDEQYADAPRTER